MNQTPIFRRIVFSVLCSLVVVICWALYLRFVQGLGWADWTGFEAYAVQADTTHTYYPAKTLWDWLQLLIVPAVLALGAIWFTREGQKAERQATEKREIADSEATDRRVAADSEATDRRVAADREATDKRVAADREATDKRVAADREAAMERAKTEQALIRERSRDLALQTYLDRMTELILNNGLRKSTLEEEEIRAIARIRTLTVLEQLDGERKAVVLKFLSEAGLIMGDKPLVKLNGANLSETLIDNANLRNCNFKSTVWRNASIARSDLASSNFYDANLTEAKFISCQMHGVNLIKAKLIGAEFLEVWLVNADMRAAVMRGLDPHVTTLTEMQDREVVNAKLTLVSLQNAQYNNDTIWPDGFDAAKVSVVFNSKPVG